MLLTNVLSIDREMLLLQNYQCLKFTLSKLHTLDLLLQKQRKKCQSVKIENSRCGHFDNQQSVIFYCSLTDSDFPFCVFKAFVVP